MMSGLNATIEWRSRLCTVNGEFGYFHIWEFYSKPLPANSLADGQPAGMLSKVFGIVEFKDGVRRVDPTAIIFCDEENHALGMLNEEHSNEG